MTLHAGEKGLDVGLIETLSAMGVELPGVAYLVGALLFGTIGLVAFWKGRRNQRPRVKWIGVALMLYPYVVWNTTLLYAVGVLLCGAWWFYGRGR